MDPRVPRPEYPWEALCAGGGAGLGLEDAGEDLQREVHDVVGLGRLERGEQVDLGERARGGLGAEHAEEAEGVEVERVGHREDEEAAGLERGERAELEVAPRRREEAGELGIEVVEEGGVDRHGGAVRGRRPGARRDGAEQAREHHDDEVVAHLELRRAARRLALAQLAQDARVDLDEPRPVAQPRRDAPRVHPRAQRELLARRGEEQPHVVHQGEGQHHAEALQPLQPAQGPERERRGVGPHTREGQRPEGAGDGRVGELGVGDGHAGKVAAPPAGRSVQCSAA